MVTHGTSDAMERLREQAERKAQREREAEAVAELKRAQLIVLEEIEREGVYWRGGGVWPFR